MPESLSIMKPSVWSLSPFILIGGSFLPSPVPRLSPGWHLSRVLTAQSKKVVLCCPLPHTPWALLVLCWLWLCVWWWDKVAPVLMLLGAGSSVHPHPSYPHWRWELRRFVLVGRNIGLVKIFFCFCVLGTQDISPWVELSHDCVGRWMLK